VSEQAVAINNLATCHQSQHVEVRLEAKLLFSDPDTNQPLSPKFPFRSRPTDAGYDLYAAEDSIIPPRRTAFVKTGIIIAAPPGFYYTLEGRSSLWSKGIVPHRGVIDATYCGQVIVALNNENDHDYQVECHDRIAQLIIHRQYDGNFVIVDEFSDLYNQRGKNGFGSTGK
jgi:deoxyuridine 5'-triphosphate nucleotidohydrolase